MKRLHKWLWERFLPTWAKESLLTENEALKAKVARQREEINRLNAYIDGFENGIRNQRRIVINNGSVKE